MCAAHWNFYIILHWADQARLRLLCIKSNDAISRHADITESPKIKSKWRRSLREQSSFGNRKMITSCAMSARRRCASSHRVAIMNMNLDYVLSLIVFESKSQIFKLPGLPPHCRLFLFLFRGFFHSMAQVYPSTLTPFNCQSCKLDGLLCPGSLF